MLRGMVLNGAGLWAWLFVGYAVVAVSIMAALVPPFCNADEAAHFLRADQIASGEVVARQPGGIADLGIGDAARPIRCRAGQCRGEGQPRDAGTAPGRSNGAGAARWDFPIPAVYPPTGYMPAAVVILAGWHLGWPIVATLDRARLASGAVCITLCAAAIALSGGMAAFLFTILCLPMSLALFATVSQDGVLIGASAMAVALVGRGARGAQWLDPVRVPGRGRDGAAALLGAGRH